MVAAGGGAVAVQGVAYDASLFRLDGDADAIAASAARWSAFSAAADDAASDVGRLDTGAFVGDEADDFRRALDADLATGLRTSARAWQLVSSALARFGATLADCQNRLRPLRARAEDAADRGDTQSLSALRSSASGIRGDHEVAVAICAADIRRAAAMRFAEPPGWFAGLVSSVGTWICDHAPVLKGISAVLKQISSLAGMLATIPALAPIMTPIAVVSGVAAVGIDAAVMAATGQGSVVDLVLDGAAMLPGARAAVAVGAVQTATATGRAAQGDGSWTDVLVSAASVAVGAKGARGRPGPRGGPPPGGEAPSAPRGNTATVEPRAGARGSEPAPAAGGGPHYGDGAAPTKGEPDGRADTTAVDVTAHDSASPDSTSPAGADRDGAGLPGNLPPGTAHLYRAGAAKVPPEWGAPIPTKKSRRGSIGLRWFGPNRNNEGVRIDAGNPQSCFTSQRVDHVIVRSGGKVLGPDGHPIGADIQTDFEAHIPLSDWVRWAEWNKP